MGWHRHEWGSKARKENARHQRTQLEREAVADQFDTIWATPGTAVESLSVIVDVPMIDYMMRTTDQLADHVEPRLVEIEQRDRIKIKRPWSAKSTPADADVVRLYFQIDDDG
jgi:hypothetical protein